MLHIQALVRTSPKKFIDSSFQKSATYGSHFLIGSGVEPVVPITPVHSLTQAIITWLFSLVVLL